MPFKPHYDSKKPQYSEATATRTREEAIWKRDKYSDKPIFFFKPDGQYGYFCQWSFATMEDEDGQKFNCCEQYMMYHKAKTFNDTDSMAAILEETNPRRQKQLGREVEGYTDAEWDKVKFDVVTQANRLKFGATIQGAQAQCYAKPGDRFVYPPDGLEDGDEEVSLKELLLATGNNYLAEASRFDAERARSISSSNWPGSNLLGKALMKVREELREELRRKEHELEGEVESPLAGSLNENTSQ